MTDLIESLLTRLSLRTRVFHRGMHCGNWHLDLEHSDKVLFHFVSKGNCMIEMPEYDANVELNQGDLLLLPRPGKHKLHALNPDQANKNSIPEHAFDDSSSELICAYVEFDSKINNPLFKALPNYVIARADSHSDSSWLKHLLGLLFAEASTEGTASQTVIERLTDILFIHIIRAYLSKYPASTGFFAAYNDPSLRKVLELIHESPQKPWSIADFSIAAKMSRSAFIEKFSRTLEMPPMTYLTHQRMEYAYRLLKEGKHKVIDVALDCGYESESSFSKAFKRIYNINPGGFNREFRFNGNHIS